MAKLINGLLGNSRNKVGNLVTYVSKGQQIARSKAANISNPRTASQMSQRIKLANVVAMYRVNRKWMEKYAFENKPKSWSVYNAFVSANVTQNNIALTKQEAAAGCCIVAPYKMSDGTLTPISVAEYTGGTGTQYKTNINCGGIDLSSATVGEFSTALIEQNNGLSNGMQFSFIMNYQQQIGENYIAFARYYEVILNTFDTNPLSDKLDLDHVQIVDSTIGFVLGQNDPYVGFCFLFSQQNGTRVRVSPSYMTVPDTGLISSFSDASHVAQAVESYGTRTEPFLGEGYQDGSNPSVTTNNSIVSAALNDGEAVPVGGYIGAVGNELAFTLAITLSQAPDDVAQVSVAAGAAGSAPSVDAVDFGISGNVVTAQFAPGAIGQAKIRKIIVNADDVNLSADFSLTEPDDSGVTE